MMTEENWKQLEQEFEKDEMFDKDGWYIGDECGNPPFNLMAWLECSSTRPSWKMTCEFVDRGYRVYPEELDSFGWLIGTVVDKKTGRKITFG